VKSKLRYLSHAACTLLLVFLLLPAIVLAQSSGPSLSGQVLDPSGGAVPGLSVSVTRPGGTALVAQTDGEGRYAFRNLPPGNYTLQIQLKGFTDFVKPGIVIVAGKALVVDAHLEVALEKQQITVSDASTKVSVTPDENASSMVIKGKDIESLSDDPDELQSELSALAGPSAGPDGGQIYIDGFTGGELPPKSSIREIRVNQNPFSAQYDSLGYGRIEVLTKPGTEKLHGQFFFSGNDSNLNTRNPFAAQVPAYHSEIFDGNIGGPINKRTSFFFDGQRRNIQDDSIVNAQVLDPITLNQVPFTQALRTPQTRTNVGPRLDTQIGNKDTITVRYQYWSDHQNNGGVGGFSLPTQAYDSGGSEHMIRVSEAHVLSERAVTEIRFRYEHSSYNQSPLSSLPTISVPQAFIGGGSSSGTTHDTENSYEFQNYTSLSLSRHFLKFGARLRDTSEGSSSNSNFNGTFSFPSLVAYQQAQQALQLCAAGGGTACTTSGASQFSIVAGSALVPVNYLDFEPYAEDDWKIRPNLTLSGGVRFETQNHIHDRADFAPRIGLAWGIGGGKSTKTVLRTGAGIFYNRFGQGLILNSERLNGINQQQYIVASPNFFPNIPSLSSLTAKPTIYQIAPGLRTPYTIQSGAGLERQVAKNVMASVTYLNTHGVHQFLSRNINAPYPGNPAISPEPFGGTSPLYEYESAGLYNQNQIISNFNVRGSKLSLSGFYTLGWVDSNTNGAGSFPENQYNLAQNYGRAPYDVRNRLFIMGSWTMPKGFQLFPFVTANSARPFNITLGQDLNGDSIFNDRPAYATSQSDPANVKATPWGTFDLQPKPGAAIIPPNTGVGFNQFSVNMRISKTFGFGRETGRAGGQRGGGGPGGGGGHGHGLGGQGLSSAGGGGLWSMGASTNRRYNVTISASARNIFNNVNLASPVGNLSSSYFGEATSTSGFFGPASAANRRIDLQVRFTF
jgi:hypothetical protein